MSNQLTSDQRSILLDAVTDAMAAAAPGVFAQGVRGCLGGVDEIARHLDALVGIARRTTSNRIEAFLVEILDHVCVDCPNRYLGGTCSLRSNQQCVLYLHAAPLMAAVVHVLKELRDEEYLRLHPSDHHGTSVTR
jgi:hypothetical protein